MEDGLKSNWKKVGKDFASLGVDLGKSIVKTVKVGVSTATQWANEKEPEDVIEEPPAPEDGASD